jgi:SAM-dependent methyltransferase
MMPRTLQAELLDTLTPDHPDALHNRRDLRLTNQLMGNHRWMTKVIRNLKRPNENILELGAGTGELCQRLGRHGIAIAGLDLWPRPSNWPLAQNWHQADLLNFPEWQSYPIVMGNLIFHQFSEEQLDRLGAQLRQSTRVIVACEPARRRVSQWLYRALGPLFGANYVSLHDAHVSIAAGFTNDELPRFLGLDRTKWDCDCSTTLLGAYHMIARRRP